MKKMGEFLSDDTKGGGTYVVKAYHQRLTSVLLIGDM